MACVPCVCARLDVRVRCAYVRVLTLLTLAATQREKIGVLPGRVQSAASSWKDQQGVGLVVYVIVSSFLTTVVEWWTWPQYSYSECLFDSGVYSYTYNPSATKVRNCGPRQHGPTARHHLHPLFFPRQPTPRTAAHHIEISNGERSTPESVVPLQSPHKADYRLERITPEKRTAL